MRQAAFAFLALLALLGSAWAQSRSDYTTNPYGLPGYSFNQVQPAPETSRGGVPSLGRRAADNLCLPPAWADSRGSLTLQNPGDAPGTCFFKSEQKERRCDCSVYRYRDVHQVGMSNDGYNSRFSPADYEEMITPCISYSQRYVGDSCSCDSDGNNCSCWPNYENYCPGGFQN